MMLENRDLMDENNPMVQRRRAKIMVLVFITFGFIAFLISDPNIDQVEDK